MQPARSEFRPRDARAVVAHGDVLPAAGRPADPHQDIAVGRGELDALARRLSVICRTDRSSREEAREIGLEIPDDADVLVPGAELHHVAALVDRVHDRDRLLVDW